MLKIPRFMKEYANFQKGISKDLIKKIGSNPEYLQARLEAQQQIDNILHGYERGMITIPEAMEMINKTV